MVAALGDRSYLVMNAHNSFISLRRMARGQTEFSLTDIAKIAGVEYHAAHAWMREGLVPASIRSAQGAGRGRNPIFSIGDALTAGIIGTCRRHGLSLEHLKLISPLFQERTRVAAATATRS
jgi:DNA-binding transcriptional MerR regulator